MTKQKSLLELHLIIDTSELICYFNVIDECRVYKHKRFPYDCLVFYKRDLFSLFFFVFIMLIFQSSFAELILSFNQKF